MAAGGHRQQLGRATRSRRGTIRGIMESLGLLGAIWSQAEPLGTVPAAGSGPSR